MLTCYNLCIGDIGYVRFLENMRENTRERNIEREKIERKKK